MEKKRNLWVIPTDKPSRLFDFMTALVLLKKASPNDSGTNQNIYITSDEYIGLSYYLDGNLVRKGVIDDKEYWKVRKDYKKIILTNDIDLILGGIQPISDEFLQWFVKNPSCEFVEIIKNYLSNNGQWKDVLLPSEWEIDTKIKYKIIIPREEPRLINNCPKCGLDLVEREGSKPVCTRIDCGGIILSNETLREWALKEEPKQTDENGKPITYWGGLEEPEQEIVGHRLKPFIDRIMVDGILKNAMPIWNDEDKSVYFIRGHVGGSLVAKMKELKVLDLWFTPIYESEEVKSDWIKEHHIDYYKKEGMMADKPKQETIEEVAERMYPINSTGGVMEMLNKHQLNNSYKQEGFIAGVKFQAEKMFNEKQMDDAYDKGFKDASESLYSEKEVFNLLNNFNKDTLKLRSLKLGNSFNVKDWFSQFKKQNNEQ